MKQENIKKEYQVDRKDASRLLKVSIRTVDRYVAQKKLSTCVVDGRVWLNKSEIGRLKYRNVSTPIVDNVDMSTGEMSIDNRVDNTVDNVDIVSTSKGEENGYSIYKNMFEEAQKELKENKHRLEAANYTVGQLEQKVKSSIPLLQYNREIEETQTFIKRIKNELKKEKLYKIVILICLLFILALQPLWLLMLK